MLPNLNALLSYYNKAPIKAYMRTYSVDQKTAESLFVDMLKYLWVSTKHKLEQQQAPTDQSLQFSFVMHQEMRDIDNMWHGFILYTEDYMKFCQSYFGGYLHHAPDVAEDETSIHADFEKETSNYLSYIYDNLGEETLRRWFATHFEDA